MGISGPAAVERDSLRREIKGLDALDVPFREGEPRLRRVWRATWPRPAAFPPALPTRPAIRNSSCGFTRPSSTRA